MLAGNDGGTKLQKLLHGQNLADTEETLGSIRQVLLVWLLAIVTSTWNSCHIV